jgi:hypothetical protein
MIRRTQRKEFFLFVGVQGEQSCPGALKQHFAGPPRGDVEHFPAFFNPDPRMPAQVLQKTLFFAAKFEQGTVSRLVCTLVS